MLKNVLDESGSSSAHVLSNEISAPYEVPQFPIEQIEKKLAIQRQISSRSVLCCSSLSPIYCIRQNIGGRPRHRWEENVGMDLKEIGINTSNWDDSV